MPRMPVPPSIFDTITLDKVNQDVILSRLAADILGLAAGDSLRIPSDGELQFSSDVILKRIATNVLGLQGGDVAVASSIRGINTNFLSGFLNLGMGTDGGAGNGSSSLDVTSLRAGSGAQGGATRLAIHPTSGVKPTAYAIAELTIIAEDGPVNFSSFNISAMTPVDTGAYRFGQEFGGTQGRRDIEFAQEDGVTAGTEIYLRMGARDGDSQRIEIDNGHLRFVTAGRGGLAASYYIARGGGTTFGLNVPTAASFQFLVNNALVAQWDAGGALLAADKQIVFQPSAGAIDCILPATDARGQIGNATYRFSLVRAVTITPGDLVFENGWKMTEAEKLGLGEGIALIKPNGEVAQVWK